MGLLSIAIWLPVAFGVLLLATGRDQNAGAVRAIALVGAVASFLVTLPLITGFDRSTAAMQFTEKLSWIERFNVHYHLGVDGLSLWFVPLTAFITVIVVIAAWQVIEQRVAQYMGAFLILSGLMVGVFCALDGLLFYVFFEATLIPMYIIIGVWGGPNRVYAAFKFFLYTLLGSLLMLIALVYLYFKSGGSFDILAWHKLPLPLSAQTLLFFAFFAAFSVKVPMWPVHTWLPDAHVEAPTGGSVVLAAIMLKLGAYGFLRFSLPIAPDAAREYDWFIISLSLIAVLYIGLVALVQQDMKKLVAYSSIAHMGFVTLGFFMFNHLGVSGRHRADDQPRFCLGRHVPVHRRALRPRALARDRGLRWRGQHHAQVRRLCRAVCDGQLRPAGHRWLRGRVDGHPGRGGLQLLARRAGLHHADLRCGVHAVDGQARVLRRCGQPPCEDAARHQRPRVPHAGLAGRGGAVDGPVPETFHRRDERLGGRAAQARGPLQDPMTRQPHEKPLCLR
jgi:hypothetical protein